MRRLPLLLIALWIASSFAAEPLQPLVGKSGPPRLRGSFMPMPLYDRARFDAAFRGELRKLPDDLPPTASYGVFTAGTAAQAFVVLSSNDGVEMILDLDADGDLTNDGSLVMKPDGSKGFGGGPLYSVTVGEGTAAPYKLAVERNDRGGLEPNFFCYLETLREGRIQIGERGVRFIVSGQLGAYGDEYDLVFLDVNGDGEIALDVHESDEIFLMKEQFVNLRGTTYAFSVTPDGGKLTLVAQAKALPGRIGLDPGNSAPDFRFTDLAGDVRSLSDYRGKIVLLYFWATWCGPCYQEAPHLIEAYENFSKLGFEIIGISQDEAIEPVLAYVEANGVRWTQTVEGREGPIGEFYRVDHIPSFLLIDRNGTIFSRKVRGASLESHLRKLLEQQP